MTEDRETQGAALNAAAMRALGSRDLPAARDLLEQATAADSRNLSAWLNLAGVRRAAGDVAGALAATDEGLKAEPRAFMAHLLRGSLLERLGRVRAAAAAYGVAVAQAPEADRLDAPTAAALAHAREVHDQSQAELQDVLADRLADARRLGSRREGVKLDQFVQHALRRRKLYPQQPTDFFYPGLPVAEFHDREDFPWLERLEAATEAISADLALALAEDSGTLEPYMAYPDGVPLDQWAELNRSPRWSAYHIIKAGEHVAGHADRCPATMAVLADLPQPQLPHRCPAAMFSVLRPRTRIPPHTGVANFRLVCHLPLVLPPGCGFRVGNETREWRRGEAFVFDDTIEHEAWNDSDQDRVVLIFDVWHPALSQAERAAISAVMEGLDAFAGSAADPGL